MTGAKVIRVIVTDLDIWGEGTEESPMRRILQYWTLDGMLLAEIDPLSKKRLYYNPFADKIVAGDFDG